MRRLVVIKDWVVLMSKSKPKKILFGCFKLVLYFILLVVLLVAVWLAFNFRFGPSEGEPLVEVSTETTRITEPLDSNGDVDFLEAVNLRCAEGVTTENNAFVKLFQVLGPIPKDAEKTSKIAKRLGIDAFEAGGSYFRDFDDWLVVDADRRREEVWKKEMGEEAMAEMEALAASETQPEPAPEVSMFDFSLDEREKMEKLFVACEFAELNPWSSEDFPEIEKWRKSHEPLMNVAREGIQRSHYYYPLVSTQLPQVMSADLHYSIEMPKLGSYLSLNAMNCLQRGDVEGCITDLKSQQKLAALISQGPTIIEELVALKVTNEAFNGFVSLCASEKADVQQLKGLLEWVSEIEMIENASERVDQMDRFLGLDAVVSMARGSAVGGVPYSIGPYSQLIDWEVALPIMNAYYDRFVEAAAVKDPKQFDEAWTLLEDEMIGNENWVMDNMASAASKGRKSKGIWMGRMLSGHLMPAIKGVVESEHAIKTKQALLKMTIAASIFKKENGQYPDALADLAPDYLDVLPNDPVSGKPFELQELENGMRIQSAQWDSSDIGNDVKDRLFIELKKQQTWEQFFNEYE